MGVVAGDASQRAVLVQGYLDGELLFHRPHAREKLGRRFDSVVEIAGMVAADHVATPA